MNTEFFERPILNSPYEYPGRHWDLDESGQPTGRIMDRRRRISFITPIPKPKKRGQREIVFDEAAAALEAGSQQYELMEVINDLRRRVDAWRAIPDPGKWRVTPETARLLQHWRGHRFGGIRPFFCQVEAVETVIWLTEVAPGLGREGRRFLDHLAAANEPSNPGLARLALKLATGAGKTTVMAMLIAWQTVNAVRRPGSRRFTRGFLVVTPGLTIRDRLRVLQPNDPDSYYRSRELVPGDMLGDLDRAMIVITNYHAFMRRETLSISKGGRELLQGRGADIRTRETPGQMLQRVVPDLLGMKNILALNDEAHHCYREKLPDEDEEGPLKGDDRKEAEKNREAARVWISGLEIVQRKLGIPFDFTARPVVAPPQPPRETVQVKAISPDRDECEIRFPRVQGYRVELPEERLSAKFDEDSTLELTPDLVGPSITRNEGIVGEGVDLSLEHLEELRPSTLVFHLTKRLLETKWRDPGEAPKLHLFGQIKRVTRQWLDGHLVCKGGTCPAQLMYQSLADVACERITRGIVARHREERPVLAVLDAYNPAGSTAHVRFTTSKKTRWQTNPLRCHVNWAICDSDWEAEFCRVAEAHPRVRAYVKNHGLGLEVPYRSGAESRTYVPDFILLVEGGRGDDDLLHLIVEIKGYRREEQPDGRARYWGAVTVPGDSKPRILRVVTLGDGETVLNAFFDRGFRREIP